MWGACGTRCGRHLRSLAWATSPPPAHVSVAARRRVAGAVRVGGGAASHQRRLPMARGAVAAWSRNRTSRAALASVTQQLVWGRRRREAACHRARRSPALHCTTRRPQRHRLAPPWPRRCRWGGWCLPPPGRQPRQRGRHAHRARRRDRAWLSGGGRWRPAARLPSPSGPQKPAGEQHCGHAVAPSSVVGPARAALGLGGLRSLVERARAHIHRAHHRRQRRRAVAWGWSSLPQGSGRRRLAARCARCH